MRKTFQLRVEGKHPDRHLEAVKHEIRKYIKRERGHALPEGADFWDFDCRFGTSQESAEAMHLSAINKLIDGVVKEGGTQFYLEILAVPGHRLTRPVVEPEGPADGAHATDDTED